MKTIAILLITIFLFSCEKEKKPKPEPEMVLTEAYIIGFDPCIRRGSHVIVTNNYEDTLVAYLMYGTQFVNRLDTIYKFPNCYEVLYSRDTIYTFPEDFNYYYREDFLFPESVRNNYKIFVNYTLTKEEEKIPIICQADFYPAQFYKHVKNRQIKINYATKYLLQSVKIR